ncbi:AzlC family ABC transporter permease [Paenibacillus sambharensis]|nr:AzlC family ABC transporter permease [Paenibacillus sambharensis]
MTDYPRRLEQVKSGLVDSLPIVMGYIPACITFGLVGKTLSLGDLEVFLLSAVVYAGASQFIGAKLLAAGTAGPIILLLTLIINLRYFFISMSFRQKVNPKSSLWSRGLISFGLTEEVYAMGMLSKTNKERKEAHTLPYLLALELPPYLITLISTWVGIILAGYIPEAYLPALNTSLYALLIAIIVPQLLGNRRNTAICLSASASSWLLQGYLGNATVLAAMFIGAWVGMMMPPSSGRTISSPGSEQVRSDVE